MKGEIEQIREKKIEKDGTVYYLVKYHGYNEKRNTWEPYTKLCEMNLSVNKLIENFEEELNKKFKSDSNKMLGGLTTITKMDETDIQIRSNKKKNYLQQKTIELNRNKNYSVNEVKNSNNNINLSINNNDIIENDNKKFNFQPKEIVDILYDPIKNKPILKIKWNEINIVNGMEKETEEDYNDFKIKYPQLLISYFEKNIKVTHQKCLNGNNEQGNIIDKNLYDILNIPL